MSAAVINLHRADRHRSAEVKRPRKEDDAALRYSLDAEWNSLGLDALDPRMPEQLRQQLRTLTIGDYALRTLLQRFVARHRAGIAQTVISAEHDRSAARLIAPELLLVLAWLEYRPFELRDAWPDDITLPALLRMAEHFGLPYDE